MPPPDYDCLCFLGSQEVIVSPKAINNIIHEWPNSKLVHIQGAQHEVLMEEPHVLDHAWKEIGDFLTG